jgi:serine/threonine-protein kinase
LRYISQIGQALEFVHHKNILHLDIKPSNILIDKKNNARLIDFGVSKRYDIQQQETSTTMLTLSKGFAPIEQYDDAGTQIFSPCPDIYSLGATMYNLLTGEIPTESILRVAKPLVKPSGINKEITPQTEVAILTAMQINSAHRYQSVKAMINELDIPSYFEETPNLLIENTETQSKIDEEATEPLSASNTSPPVDEDQTLVRQSEGSNKPVQKKKKKRKVLIPVLIFVFAFLGCGIAYLVYMDETQGANQIEELLAVFKRNAEVAAVDSTNITGEFSHEEDNQGVTTTNTQPTEPARQEVNNRTETNIAPENPNTPPNDNENTLSSEERDAQYTALIMSGKTKMSQKNFAEAKADLMKAHDLKPTDEVRNLLLELSASEEGERILARKALYDDQQRFGDELMIVKEKSTGLWGAVDNKYLPVIPCEYLGVRRPSADDRRAFVRRDNNHFDIYDTKGINRGSDLDTY